VNSSNGNGTDATYTVIENKCGKSNGPEYLGDDSLTI
jgi:hypothetical protein